MFLSKHLTQVVLSSLLLSATAFPPDRRATVCNGHSELCGRSFGNVTFVGAHDSYAIGVNNLAANQDQNLTQQLNDGIRMLQVQAHSQLGEIRLCHTSCALFDGGTLQAYLTTVKTWLNANPNEVLSMLIVNIDNLPASAFDTVFKAAGVDSMSFSPATSTLTASAWPTLGSMISSGNRLVVFLDNGADPTVSYLIDEFTNMWETAFDVVDPNLFDCSVNRTKAQDTATQLGLINHFLDMLVLGQPAPDVAKANITNGASGPGSLGAQVNACIALNSRSPNFMLVDFYEFGGGSVFQVAATANGVTYSSTPAVPPGSTSSSSSTPSSNGSYRSALPLYDQMYLVTFLIVMGIFGAYTVV